MPPPLFLATILNTHEQGFDCDGNCLEGALTNINVSMMNSYGTNYSLIYYGGEWSLTNKLAIIEKESLGGVCLNWGCIPTKALLKSAQVFEYINAGFPGDFYVRAFWV